MRNKIKNRNFLAKPLCMCCLVLCISKYYSYNSRKCNYEVKTGCLVSNHIEMQPSEMTLIEILKLIVLLLCFLAGFSTGKTEYSITDFLTLLYVS